VVIAAVVGAAAIAALALGIAVHRAQRTPETPQPIAWDREPCAHCHMLIGEQAYAAQLVTADGLVFSFDDPGCLMTFLDERKPEVHKIWLHDSRSDRWLEPAEAGFLPAQTPMGYGLAAVPRGTPGAIDWDEARARPRARAAGEAGMP
jgi:copper chaperone NosL